MKNAIKIQRILTIVKNQTKNVIMITLMRNLKNSYSLIEPFIVDQYMKTH